MWKFVFVINILSSLFVVAQVDASDPRTLKDEGIKIIVVDQANEMPIVFVEKENVFYKAENPSGRLLKVKQLAMRVEIPNGIPVSNFNSWLHDALVLRGFSVKKIMMIRSVYFDSNSTRIRNDMSAALDNLIEVMMEYPDSHMKLSIYADSRGSKTFNKILSSRRGESLIKYIGNSGITVTRLILDVQGEEALKQPYSKEKKMDENHYQHSRRADFTFLPTNP